ncbi:MAG: type VI secretion system-associated FHA domain protein [Nannocystaceae bacterium]|jgi:type VI secretion system FHA domain protein
MAPISITVFDAETGTTSEYSFTKSPVRIGRNPLNDLSLPFPFVSGWHAIVRFDDEAARFFDLGSTNGTLLDGRKVQAGEPVDIGEMLSVTIGKLELRLSRGADRAAAAVAATPAAPTPWATAPAVMPTAAWAVVGAIEPGQLAARHTAAAPAGTAHVPMHEIHEAVSALRPAVDQYRRSWAAVFAAVHRVLSTMDAGTRQFALSVLQREFPDLDHEPEFAQTLAQAGVSAAAARPAAGGEVGQVAQLARAVRAGEEPPRTPEESARFLRCVEDVLRASAKAFVELQKGQEQFGNEMGVRTIKEFTPLHAAGTADNVLKYLLDWQVGGPHRTQELVGVYADLMIHQVALINGMLEGARGLLARLDPGEIERSVTAAWPTRGAALWKQYMQRHRELMESDRLLTEALFGPEFARAYAEVGGEGGGRPGRT